MTIETILQTTVDLPRNEAELLLAFVLKKDRAWVLAHPESALTFWQARRIASAYRRRRKHEPLAYIVGEKEFYGRLFFVNQSVLVPRPSTEGLIDTALTFLNDGQNRVTAIDADVVAVSRAFGDLQGVETIVDIGTGSGCIAVTVAAERPKLHIIATDRSRSALRIAKRNASRHQLSKRITFFRGNGLDPVQHLTAPFVIISNPPYISAAEKLMPDVANFEPALALYAGAQGLDRLRQFTVQAKAHAACRGVIFECRSDQVAQIASA